MSPILRHYSSYPVFFFFFTALCFANLRLCVVAPAVASAWLAMTTERGGLQHPWGLLRGQVRGGGTDDILYTQEQESVHEKRYSAMGFRVFSRRSAVNMLKTIPINSTKVQK